MIGGREARGSSYEAVVAIGRCSGVLVQPDILLTSAHCLEGTIDRIVVAGGALPVVGCVKHPKYEPFRPEHDMALCRLGSTARARPIALGQAQGSELGGALEMVGFGQTAAFARGSPERRVVSTTASAVGDNTMEVGDAQHTACHGDSGGLVLAIHKDGSPRVVGVVHGPTGAFCLSPTLAIRVTSHRDWFIEEHAYGAARRGPWWFVPLAILTIGVLCAAAAILRRAMARRRRRLCSERGD